MCSETLDMPLLCVCLVGPSSWNNEFLLQCLQPKFLLFLLMGRKLFGSSNTRVANLVWVW